MSTNQIKGRSGRTVQVAAPTGGLTKDDLFAIRTGTGGFCGVVHKTKLATEIAVIEYGHHVEVNKNTGTGESFAVGTLVYHDAATDKATPTATGNDLAGAAMEVAGTAATKVFVQLGSSA